LEIKERKIKSVYEFTLEAHIDARGFFMRTYDSILFQENGIDNNWVQENHSKSEQKGIIRGLHFQLPPFSETKLVRCIVGSVLDVFVDLRKDSDTFGSWDSIELSAENKKMILIPRGFAHGFLTLTDISEIVYKVDNFYSNEYERGLIWNDSRIGIKWPTDNPILSFKDSNNMFFDDYVNDYNGIKE
jgi:dTDP-4-dehydrorhamnose 3,5-epimerase